MKNRARIPSLLLLLVVAACGKKGPPLPPLVRIPNPPGEFSAQRRGSTVAIQFSVPGRNTDGSSPADVVRVDLFALTAPPSASASEIVQRGTRVGTVLVNPPPDPDAPEGVPAAPSGPLPPGGINQNATARFSESFTVDPGLDPTALRSYVAVGFNKRGRRGEYSQAVSVPTGTPPNSPGKPDVIWGETSITVAWPPAESTVSDVTLSYHVYVPGEVPVRLTSEPLAETSFVDSRIEWGAERCYVVRSVQMIENLPLESEASPETCRTLADTFPPAAPEGLTVVAASGAMNLIWTPNKESDVAGYALWRAMPPEADLVSITPSLVKETTFRDEVPAGARVAYALQAVDKAGNVSAMSARVEETAR